MATVLTREYWERIIENVKPYKNHTNKGEDYAISNSCFFLLPRSPLNPWSKVSSTTKKEKSLGKCLGIRFFTAEEGT